MQAKSVLKLLRSVVMTPNLFGPVRLLSYGIRPNPNTSQDPNPNPNPIDPPDPEIEVNPKPKQSPKKNNCG